MSDEKTPTFEGLHALIIDDIAEMRGVLRSQLAALGITRVDQAKRADEALSLLRANPYGLVLCDFNLEDHTNGQQVLEHARANNLIGPDTIYFMVTAERDVRIVASASEVKPDAYLLKPVVTADIQDRLTGLLSRREALLPITQRLRLRDLTGAVAECDRLALASDRWAPSARQFKGQALLELGRPEEAKAVYLQELALNANIVWAQLGLARCHRALGSHQEAIGIAMGLLTQKSGEKCAEAYDVVAQSMEAQGDEKGALEVLVSSQRAVPSPKRARLVAECAYRSGDLATARAGFAEVVKATRGSVVSRASDSLALAQALVDNNEAPAALALLQSEVAARRDDKRFEDVAMSLRAQALTKTGDMIGARKALAQARAAKGPVRADQATLALAKAELAAGTAAAGLALLSEVVKADHENPAVKQLVRNALKHAGQESALAQVVDGAVEQIAKTIAQAKHKFGKGQFDEGLAEVEEMLASMPENTGLLLEAASLGCLWLRMKKTLAFSQIEKVKGYLAKLDRLLPGNERVAQTHRRLRETLTEMKKANP